MKDILKDGFADEVNCANYDTATRVKVPALVRGYPGFIEYRGMPWLRGMYSPVVAESPRRVNPRLGRAA